MSHGDVWARDQREVIDAALAKSILDARQTLAETQDFCERRVPRMPRVESAEQWLRQAERYQREVEEKVLFRGQAAQWRQTAGTVEWLETIEGGPGYRIKKLRYEALPGLWIPALLYEPLRLEGKVPVVLNVNGHDPVGKAVEYKQIRCINEAKRGMLALNVEWYGMGQLRTDGFKHGLINAIDLCGTSGIAVHYLMLRRGLDVLLAHAHADVARVAVTGLSGGGWQTIFISGLDPRVTLTDPVAGYSSFLTRVRQLTDLGDSEQTPCDLGTVVDYTHLTAMMAPKPTLLTFNVKDDCCFASGHALPPLLDAARPIFRLFDAEKNLAFHINEDPGTHNYGIDNRKAFYRMIGAHFFAGDTEYPTDELPCDGELKTAEQLHVTTPDDALDFARLATQLAADLPRAAKLPDDRAAAERWQTDHRLRLRGLVRPFDPPALAEVCGEEKTDGMRITRLKLRVGQSWTVPAVEFERDAPKATATALILADTGRAKLGKEVEALLDEGFRVVALDPFYVGEAKVADHDSLFALLIGALGERPLGVQTGQILASARWFADRKGDRPVTLVSVGPRTSVVVLASAALEPRAIARVVLHQPIESLKSLVDRHAVYDEAPELFCFGLLESFDVTELAALVAPRPVELRVASDALRERFDSLKPWQALLSD